MVGWVRRCASCMRTDVDAVFGRPEHLEAFHWRCPECSCEMAEVVRVERP